METRADLIEHRRENGNEAAFVFIHGFSGDPSKTWGKFPDFLLAKSELNGWDVLRA